MYAASSAKSGNEHTAQLESTHKKRLDQKLLLDIDANKLPNELPCGPAGSVPHSDVHRCR